MLCFLYCPLAEAQIKLTEDLGGTVGLTVNFGTKVNRLGLQVGAYYAKSVVQINSGLRVYYSLNSYGPKGNRAEFMLSFGALLGYGETDTLSNPFIHPLSNQTIHRYGVAYAYNIYLDQVKTSQSTGTLALHFPNTEIMVENDILSGSGKDEYRTGALQIAYYYQQKTRLSLNAITWTGCLRNDNKKRVRESDYPARFGYFDISGCPYGGISHGIFGAQVQYALPYAQVASVMVGADSEKIRHALQNKFMHDMPMVPKKWNTAENPHIPMVADDGNPFLFKPGQKLRPNKFFLDFGFNPTVFY